VFVESVKKSVRRRGEVRAAGSMEMRMGGCVVCSRLQERRISEMGLRKRQPRVQWRWAASLWSGRDVRSLPKAE
jgi:hypothetical protein